MLKSVMAIIDFLTTVAISILVNRSSSTYNRTFLQFRLAPVESLWITMLFLQNP